MRSLYSFLLLLAFSFNFSYSQVHEQIRIPVLKESAKIDSLMDIILNPKTSYAGNNKSLEGNWLIMSMWKTNDNYFRFGVGTASEVQVNFSANIMVHDKVNIGYFQYKQYKIFVWAPDDFYDFFYKTSKPISYDYIYRLNDLDHAPDQLLGWKSWDYKYQNGHFSPDPPPQYHD